MTSDHREKLEHLIQARTKLIDAARLVREAADEIRQAALGLDLSANIEGAREAARRIESVAARIGIVMDRIPS